MATYLPGVQDKVEKVRPPQPNLQFESQMLSTRQSKYDQGHKQLSDMYGKILNAGLTRESNVEARDDFFKLIDGDLKKIAGIDLSKQSNVTKAQNVFSQVYDNDFLVKDMVWTKNYQNELQKAEQYKNCIDPEECGGAYWDEGMKYMQYKKQEFAETDNADSLNFQNAEFVPYQNIMKKAMKAAEDSGLSVTYEQLRGNYMVTTKNGAALVSPLTELFEKLYADNPGYQKQFEVESYTERKDWASGKVQSGEFASMQEAEVGYITQQSKLLTEAVDKIKTDIGADNEVIDRQLESLNKMIASGKMTEGSDDHKKYMELTQLKGMSDQAKKYAEISQTALKNANNHGVIRNIGAQLDKASGLVKLDREIKGIAKTLSHRDEEITMEADEFAKMRVKHGYDAAMEGMRQRGRIELEGIKQAGRLELLGAKETLPISNVAKIEKDFKKINGSSNLLKDITADAKKEFRTLSADDINDQTNDRNPDNPLRIKLLKQNAEAIENQNNYIARKQAEMLNQQTKSTVYTEALDAGENELWAGSTVPTTSSVDYSGGGGGGGYSGGGGGGTPPFMDPSSGGTPSPRTTQTPNQGGTPPAKTTKPKASNADLSKEANADIDNMMSIVAQEHPDPAKKKYYADIIKKGGYAKADEKNKALIQKSLGKRLDQITTSTTWQMSQGTEHDARGNRTGTAEIEYTWYGMPKIVMKGAVAGRASTNFNKGYKPQVQKKIEISSEITKKYLDRIDVDSDEFKSLQNDVEKYLIKYGESTSMGTLTFTGNDGKTHKIGQLYRDFSEGGSSQYRPNIPLKRGDLVGKASGDRDELRGVYLHGNTRDEQLSLDVIKAVTSSSQWMSNHIYKKNIKDKEPRGDYFKSKGYKEAVKQYDLADDMAKGYQESKQSNREDMMSVVTSNLKGESYFQEFKDVDGGPLYEASDFVDERGMFKIDPDGMNDETIKMGRKMYMDAMDEVYKKGGYKGGSPYMPGLGNRIANNMVVHDINLGNNDDQGTVRDVREYLNEMKLSDFDNNTGSFQVQSTVNGANIMQSRTDKNERDRLINSLMNGEIDITSVEFNPIAGTSGAHKSKINKNDWTRLTINTDEGGVYEFDLDSQVHATKLLEKSQNTDKSQMLSDVGQYTYRQKSVLTGDEPVKLYLDGDGVGVQGSVYEWDDGADKFVYTDLNEFISPEFLQANTPETIEFEIDRIVRIIGEKDYDTHNPKVQ